MVGVYAVTKIFRVVPAFTIEAHVEKCKMEIANGGSETRMRNSGSPSHLGITCSNRAVTRNTRAFYF